ncbi:protein kinase 2 [Pelomyxa schiedti]|nr:protein kinase 2 [Pelomyxa schiedti]
MGNAQHHKGKNKGGPVDATAPTAATPTKGGKKKGDKKPKKGKKGAASADGAAATPADPAATPTASATTTSSTSTASAAATTASSDGDLHGYDESEYGPLDQILGDKPAGMLFSKTSQKVTKEDFTILTLIGRGSFGKVLRVEKKDDHQIYAMKVLKKSAIIARKQVAHTLSEKVIMQQIEHPFIVKLHYAFQTPEKLYMVMDFVNGGELFYHLKNDNKFEEPRVKMYAGEIALALEHLHALGIVYRDLKPENILIDFQGEIRITDFGLSKQLQTTAGTSTFCGTPEYLAPEVLKGKPHGTPVDWWSLGTLIFEMLTGLPPFYNPNHAQMYQRILSGDIKYPSEVTPDARSLLAGLLQQDPEKRFSAKQVRAHPWFAGMDWDALYHRSLTPPWKPPIKDTTSDVSQIDETFTSQATGDSVDDKPVVLQATDQNQFVGFSFQESTLGS